MSTATQKLALVRRDKAPITYSVRQVPIERIRAFAFQPRKWFDPDEIAARAASMRELGQQDPVTVEPVDGDPEHDYELINGESRLRSAHAAGLATLWAAVRSRPFGSRAEKHLASLVANFNRSDHTPMEISDALHVQVTEGGRSHAQVARAIGKSDWWVSDYLSLQNLHEDIKPLLHPTTHKSRRLAPGVAFVLARIDRAQQLQVLKAAQRADGKVTQLRVKIEAARLGISRRTHSMETPSRRRERLANTLRSLKLDVDKLQALVARDAAAVARAAKTADLAASLEVAKAACDSPWNAERMARYARHHARDEAQVRQLRRGIEEFRRLLDRRSRP
jgi:ParB/RepB/Spo0J family partition protein